MAIHELVAQALALVLMYLLFYVLIIRPERREKMDAWALAGQVAPGWRVVTEGGMRGVVTAADPDRDLFEVEISPGVRISLTGRGFSEAYPPESVEDIPSLCGEREDLPRPPAARAPETASGRSA